jgi:hypothetical protein
VTGIHTSFPRAGVIVIQETGMVKGSLICAAKAGRKTRSSLARSAHG